MSLLPGHNKTAIPIIRFVDPFNTILYSYTFNRNSKYNLRCQML
jgi:hypothetical protein